MNSENFNTFSQDRLYGNARSLNDLIICPYETSHIVGASRCQQHLIKCRKNNPGLAAIIGICPYNQSHHVPKVDMALHLNHCQNYLSYQVQQCSRNRELSLRDVFENNDPRWVTRMRSEMSECETNDFSEGFASFPSSSAGDEAGRDSPCSVANIDTLSEASFDHYPSSVTEKADSVSSSSSLDISEQLNDGLIPDSGSSAQGSHYRFTPTQQETEEWQ